MFELRRIMQPPPDVFVFQATELQIEGEEFRVGNSCKQNAVAVDFFRSSPRDSTEITRDKSTSYIGVRAQWRIQTTRSSLCRLRYRRQSSWRIIHTLSTQIDLPGNRLAVDSKSRPWPAR
jgi:hypothetical protein